MSSKTTPEKKNKKKHMEPSKINMEEEPQPSRFGKKYTYKQRDSSTIAVVNPRMIQRLPTSSNIVQSYRPPSTVSQLYRPPSSIGQAYRSPLPVCQSYLQPRPVYPERYTRPPPMPVPTVFSYAPPPIVRSYHPNTSWCTTVTTCPVQSPIYAIPVPTIPAIPVPVYSAVPRDWPYTPHLSPAVIAQPPRPIFSPVPTTECPSKNMFILSPNFEAAFYELQQAIEVPQVIAGDASTSNGNNFIDNLAKKQQKSPKSSKQTRPLNPEDYLVLPRHLFPTARTISVDPNPIIDQFCRFRDCEKNSLWILDLEFGVPREPVTRPIATYNVQLHNIHCKNNPDAVHPGFESCSHDFKNMFLFYYDSVVSAWYKGFIVMNKDRSVANFQSWLDVPMQIYGMCWP